MTIYKNIVQPIIIYACESRAEPLKTSHLMRRIEMSVLRAIIHREIEHLIQKYEDIVVYKIL